MPEFSTVVSSDEYAVIRRMRFTADDEFDAIQMATEDFLLHVGKDDNSLHVIATEKGT